MEEMVAQPPQPTLAHIIKHFLKKGGINVAFRLSPPFMLGCETYFTSVANSTMPGSLAALGLAHPARHLFTHLSGSNFNLLPQKFADAKQNGHEHTANLWLASQLAGLAMNIPTILAMVWTGDFLKLCGVDPDACDKLTAFLRAFAIGYPTIQAFSVNRQFIYSPCGDENGMKEKYVLPLIGLVEALFYILFAYGLIEGKLGFDMRGIQGSGYALSISNTVALTGSMALLFGSPNLRKYLLRKPNLSLIKKYFREIFKDGFPVMSRFLMENLSFISMTLIAIAISQNQVSALQICNTLLLPLTLTFSFISGIKAEIMLTDLHPTLLKKVFTLIALPTAFSLLLLPVYAGIPKQLSSLFLGGHTADNQRAIETINEKALPLLASVEILNTGIHGVRTVLQKAKDLWYPTGVTFLFLCAAFIPTAFVAVKAFGKELPGMATAYLIFMFAVLIAMALRFGYILKNPAKNAIGCLNPKRCWAMFFPSHDPERERLLPANRGDIQGRDPLAGVNFQPADPIVQPLPAVLQPPQPHAHPFFEACAREINRIALYELTGDTLQKACRSHEEEPFAEDANPETEGKLIAKKFNTTLHIIDLAEKEENPDQKIIEGHIIVTGEEYTPVRPEHITWQANHIYITEFNDHYEALSREALEQLSQHVNRSPGMQRK